MKSISIAFLMATLVATNAFPCTIFSISDGGSMLVGNNEDFFYDKDYFMKVVPAGSDSFGRLTFVTKEYLVLEVVQGGMNDQGLFVDGATTPVDSNENSNTRQSFKRIANFDLLDRVLATCKDVPTAVAYLRDTKFESPKFHLFLADRAGKSIIVEWTNGQMRVVLPSQNCLIATNYLLTSKSKPTTEDLERESIIAKHLKRDATVTITNVGKILYESMQAGSDGGTLYSNIYDLQHLTMTVFLRGKWAAKRVYSLSDLLRKGPSMMNVKELS